MRQPVLLAAYTLLGFASFGCLSGVPSPKKDIVATSVSTRTPPATVAAETEQKTRAQKPDSDDRQPPQAPIDNPRSSRAHVESRPRAMVGNEPILDDEVEYQMYHLGYRPGSPISPEELRKKERQALDHLIEREILMQHIEAMLHGPGEKLLETLRKETNKEFEKAYVYPLMKNQNLASDEELKDFVVSKQVPLELMRRDFQRNAIVNQFLGSVISPHFNTIDRSMIQEYYDVHTEDFNIPDRVDWQVFFIFSNDSRYANRQAAYNHAQVVAQRARDGEDFASLVEQFDYGLHKGAKGKGIGHLRSEIRPEMLAKDLFEMRENEVRVIPSETGHYIVRLVKRVHAGRKPFDVSVQKEIELKLKQDVYKRERDATVADLKKKIPWWYLDDQGHPIQPELSRDRPKAPSGAP